MESTTRVWFTTSGDGDDFPERVSFALVGAAGEDDIRRVGPDVLIEHIAAIETYRDGDAAPGLASPTTASSGAPNGGRLRVTLWAARAWGVKSRKTRSVPIFADSQRRPRAVRNRSRRRRTEADRARDSGFRLSRVLTTAAAMSGLGPARSPWSRWCPRSAFRCW